MLFAIDLKGYGHLLVDGAITTIEVSLCAFLVSIVLGLVSSVGSFSRNLAVRCLSGAYTAIIRGIPELVLLLLVYYGGTMLVQRAAAAIRGEDVRVDINNFIAGVLVVGFVYGAFAAEVFRGAFQSIPRGQEEAAKAHGMSRSQVFWRIRLPQVWRFAIPGLGNVSLVEVKATAIISAIGLPELTRQADIVKQPTHLPFTVFCLAAIAYLAMTLVLSTFWHHLERRASLGYRRA